MGLLDFFSHLGQESLVSLLVALIAVGFLTFLIDKIREKMGMSAGFCYYLIMTILTVTISIIISRNIEPVLFPREDAISTSRAVPYTQPYKTTGVQVLRTDPTSTSPKQIVIPTPTGIPTPTPTATPTKRPLTHISFSGHNFKKGKKRFYIYSGPSSTYWYKKTKNGTPAYGSINDVIYVAGYVGNWLLIKYETSNNKYRMGYTNDAKGDFQELTFDYFQGKITKSCSLSDGVDSKKLKKGTTVTVLGRMDNGIYVEAFVDGKQARGTVPESCVNWQ